MFVLQVEAVMSASPYVDNIMVYANSFHSYCVALVVASQPAIESRALQKGIKFDDFASLCETEETVKEVYGSLLKVTIYYYIFTFKVASIICYMLYVIVITWVIRYRSLQAAKTGRLEKFEIPAKIKLLSEAWTPESGLVTAALKLKRDVIRKTFSEELAKFYQS